MMFKPNTIFDIRLKAGLGQVQRTQQQGIALLEFALVFPFLLLLVTFGFDLALCFRNKQNLERYSREAALHLSEKCRRPTTLTTGDNAASYSAWSRCLTEVSNDLQYYGTQSLGEIGIISQMWTYEPDGGSVELQDYFPLNSNGDVSLYIEFSSRNEDQSMLALENFNQGTNLFDLIALKRSLFALQVISDYQPMFIFTKRLFGYSNARPLYAIGIT